MSMFVKTSLSGDSKGCNLRPHRDARFVFTKVSRTSPVYTLFIYVKNHVFLFLQKKIRTTTENMIIAFENIVVLP